MVVVDSCVISASGLVYFIFDCRYLEVTVDCFVGGMLSTLECCHLFHVFTWIYIYVNYLEFMWDRDSFCFTSSTTGFVSRTERSSFVLRRTIFERHAFSQTDGQRVTLETDKVTE